MNSTHKLKRVKVHQNSSKIHDHNSAKKMNSRQQWFQEKPELAPFLCFYTSKIRKTTRISWRDCFIYDFFVSIIIFCCVVPPFHTLKDILGGRFVQFGQIARIPPKYDFSKTHYIVTFKSASFKAHSINLSERFSRRITVLKRLTV